MRIELNNEDLEAVLYALGELPTKTNVFMLAAKIRTQIEKAQGSSELWSKDVHDDV